jgi:hypothetical protein
VRVAVSGTEGGKIDGVYVRVGTRNGRHAFDKEGTADGALYYDGKFWKCCRKGRGMTESGWNFSQKPAGASSMAPPLGRWLDSQKTSESSEDYSRIQLQIVAGNGSSAAGGSEQSTGATRSKTAMMETYGKLQARLQSTVGLGPVKQGVRVDAVRRCRRPVRAC